MSSFRKGVLLAKSVNERSLQALIKVTLLNVRVRHYVENMG